MVDLYARARVRVRVCACACACVSRSCRLLILCASLNVPPPKSKTSTFFAFTFLSRPYAIAAAVGSFSTRSTFIPAIRPASLVACRCASLKYLQALGVRACVHAYAYARRHDAAHVSLYTTTDTHTGLKYIYVDQVC